MKGLFTKECLRQKEKGRETDSQAKMVEKK